jgi:hypothetical protein
VNTLILIAGFLVSIPVYARIPCRGGESRHNTENPAMADGLRGTPIDGVHDPIYHRIALIDDGSTQVVIVASDICVFSPGVYDEAAAEIRREFGPRAKATLVDRHPHALGAGGWAAGCLRRAVKRPQ